MDLHLPRNVTFPFPAYFSALPSSSHADLFIGMLVVTSLQRKIQTKMVYFKKLTLFYRKCNMFRHDQLIIRLIKIDKTSLAIYKHYRFME